MRYPAEETAERHERILDAAARLFRRDGFDGVSVAEVMKTAGLTHGGFYAHFESKDALAAAGVELALTEMLDLADRAGGTSNAYSAFIAQYLSILHRDNPEHGCVMAALAPEIARKSGPVRRTFTTGLSALIDRVATTFSAKQRDSRTEAIATLSTLVGSLLLARAVDDPALSTEILSAGRAHFGLDPEVTDGRSEENETRPWALGELPPPS